MNAEQIRQARTMLTRPEESVSSIARLLGVSRSTLYKYLPELTESRGQLTAANDQSGSPIGRSSELPLRRAATAESTDAFPGVSSSQAASTG